MPVQMTYFMWCIRSVEPLAWFPGIIEELGRNPKITVIINVTKGDIADAPAGVRPYCVR